MTPNTLRDLADDLEGALLDLKSGEALLALSGAAIIEDAIPKAARGLREAADRQDIELDPPVVEL